MPSLQSATGAADKTRKRRRRSSVHDNDIDDDDDQEKDMQPHQQHQDQGAALGLPTSGLNRGFACMGCRKRKSRCVLSTLLPGG